jgi:hypothetical protein
VVWPFAENSLFPIGVLTTKLPLTPVRWQSYPVLLLFYLLSNGAFEVERADGTLLTFEGFLDIMTGLASSGTPCRGRGNGGETAKGLAITSKARFSAPCFLPRLGFGGRMLLTWLSWVHERAAESNVGGRATTALLKLAVATLSLDYGIRARGNQESRLKVRRAAAACPLEIMVSS